jgi:molybdopterin converting factor subunit 1
MRAIGGIFRVFFPGRRLRAAAVLSGPPIRAELRVEDDVHLSAFTSSMRVTIKLFAILRERAGTSELELTLADHATVADARRELLRQHPELAGLLERAAFAVNRNYADLRTPINEGDELAALPPVSGG